MPIDYLAVFAAAAPTFLIGGLWYSPLLFQRAWMRANNLTENDLRAGGQAKIFGLSFVFALVMALNLAMFLNAPDTTTTWGATAGLLAAIWVALGIGTVALRASPIYLHGDQRRVLARLIRRPGRDSGGLAVTIPLSGSPPAACGGR